MSQNGKDASVLEQFISEAQQAPLEDVRDALALLKGRAAARREAEDRQQKWEAIEKQCRALSDRERRLIIEVKRAQNECEAAWNAGANGGDPSRKRDQLIADLLRVRDQLAQAQFDERTLRPRAVGV